VTAGFISVPETTYPTFRAHVSLETWIIRMSLKTGFLGMAVQVWIIRLSLKTRLLGVLLQMWILRSSLSVFLKQCYILFCFRGRIIGTKTMN